VFAKGVCNGKPTSGGSISNGEPELRQRISEVAWEVGFEMETLTEIAGKSH
jgi:hypothetical protein